MDGKWENDKITKNKGVRVTIPGGAQKTYRHGTSGHGLAGMVVLG